MTDDAQPEPPRLRPPAALLDEVNRDLAGLARLRRWRLAGFVAVALGALVAMILNGRGDPATGAGGFTGVGCGAPLHGVLMGLLAMGGFALCALAFGIRLPAGRQLRAVPLAAVGLSLAVLFTLSSAFGAPGDDPYGPTCFHHGGLVAAGLIVAAALFGRDVLRRHAPSAALYGVGAGMLALVPLGMKCHVGTMDHLMIWHGLVPVAAGLVSWGVARIFGRA